MGRLRVQLRLAELRHVVDVIRQSFDEAIWTRRAARLKNGKILKGNHLGGRL